jgi:hypothetical protein
VRSVRVNLSHGRWFRGTVISETETHVTVEVTDPGTVQELISRHVLCSKERVADWEQSTEWVSFSACIPLSELAIMDAAIQAQGFQETDWCEYTRGDGASVTWGPCEPPRSD